MNFVNPNDLFQYFKESIRNASIDEITALKNDIQTISKQGQDEILASLQSETNELLQLASQEIAKEYKLQIAKYEVECQKNVVSTRSHLMDQLFEELVARLEIYQASKEYQKKIAHELKQFEKEKIKWIEVSPKDQFISDLKLGVPVKENSHIMAGYRIYFQDNKRLIDETMNNKLADAKRYFLEFASWFIQG